MRFLVLILFITSCSENSSHYFPLDKIKTWSYSVEIIPEVEDKALYKKIHISMGEQKVSLNEEKKKLFPILRENGTTLYYEFLDDGVYRVGKKFFKEKKIKIKKNTYLGDIIISYNYLDKPRSQDLKSFKEKVAKILIHGFLHLLGFDHKKNKDYSKMLKEEDLLFKSVQSKIN